MEVRVNCSNRQNKSERKRKRSVFASHLLQIILQHSGSRMQGGGGVVGQAAVQPACGEQKAFLSRNAVRQGGSSVLVLQLLSFSGLCCHQTDTYYGRVRKGWPTSLGDLLLPNDTQTVSCYCWSAFSLQACVTVVPELVPYWRLILGEREKSGQYGSH